jgi:hypothetical protein
MKRFSLGLSISPRPLKYTFDSYLLDECLNK